MTTALADSVAHAFGLIGDEADNKARLRSPEGQEETSKQLQAYMDEYGAVRLEDGTSPMIVDFAARFLPSLINAFLDSDSPFRSAKGYVTILFDLVIQDTFSTPSLSRLLRDQRSMYTDLFAYQLDSLLASTALCAEMFHAPTIRGNNKRARFQGLVYIVADLTAFLAHSGVSLTILGVHLDQIREIRRLSGLLRRKDSPLNEADLSKLNSCLDVFDAIGKAFWSGVTDPAFLETPTYLFHWDDCEAISLSGAGPCARLPDGEEMPCCSNCLAVRYCSPAHQKVHWKTHKKICFKPTW